MRNRGLIDPNSIDEYIAYDGYFALAKALDSMSPEHIIDEVKKSGLRGEEEEDSPPEKVGRGKKI